MSIISKILFKKLTILFRKKSKKKKIIKILYSFSLIFNKFFPVDVKLNKVTFNSIIINEQNIITFINVSSVIDPSIISNNL